MFKSFFSETIFKQKYRHENAYTWEELAATLVHDVCRNLIPNDDKETLIQLISDMKFIPGGRYLYYCFDPAEKILKQDYTWDSAQNIKVGDVLVGFDETIRRSRFKPTTVTFTAKQQTQKYRVNTSMGSVVVSGDHQFVAKPRKEQKKKNHCYQWIAAKDLIPGNCIAFSAKPWDVDTSYDAGWLSGIMDGEGTVSKGSISISQKPGLVLDKIIRVLSEKGIQFYMRGRDTDTVKTVEIRGRWESVKALGMFRPIRLLERWSREEMGSFWSRIQPCAVVESIEPLGMGEVCVIETSEKTLIGNGFLSHNCGRKKKFWNQCFLLKAIEDTREDWADLSQRAESCLMTGGGIGVNYDVYRAAGSILHGTGGAASGPIPKMQMINEIGRYVIQGGSRRSAMYASLNWRHGDINDFLTIKNWDRVIPGTKVTLAQVKAHDFNFPAPLDMTNISINYDTDWLMSYWKTGHVGDVFLANVRQALSTGEPGFSFNFFDKENEILRNPCGEAVSSDESDVCNLGSVNMAAIDSIDEFRDVVRLSTRFLLCGAVTGELPYAKVYEVRERNRRVGLGLMGIHEWLIQHGYRYEVVPELRRYLSIYKGVSDRSAKELAASLSIAEPIAKRAIAPTGSLGILANTTTGIEPIYAVAYKRRYLKGTTWHYQYVIDSAAQGLIDRYGVSPDSIESAVDLASDFERRIKFQADIQDYVDQAISSTINLPAWGSELNNEAIVNRFASTLASYASRLRGFTCYPDGSRGGQPITSVPYHEARQALGNEYKESVVAVDVCDLTGKGGTCGA